MCGIIGYVGREQAAPILLDGLSKLEYRGYDSAGVAVYSSQKGLEVAKSKGKIKDLYALINGGAALEGAVGIGHTRWATHGQPSDINSHPHVSDSGNMVVVHNGIIENYIQIKEFLIAKGVRFVSETDTEVVAQLLDYYYNGNLLAAVAKVLSRIQGSYALGILCRDCPDQVIAARKDSPLILGFGEHCNFLASDVTAILKHTRDVCYLDDGEIAVLTKDRVTVYNTDLDCVEKEHTYVDWEISAAEKGGYEHFMFKEILEQPKAVKDTISPRIRDGRVVLDDVKLTKEEVGQLDRLYIIACGSSYHVGVVAKYMLERYTRIPVEVALASEFRYCDPIVSERTLVVAISQSGETADTRDAMREAKRLGARTLAIVNVVGSTISKEADDVIYTWAGPEIAVATTKAYSAQLAVMQLLTLYLGDLTGKMSRETYDAVLAGLVGIPEQMEDILSRKEEVQYLASLYFNNRSVFFLGRNLDYAIGMEGSLKLKEISYIHSEAYAAGELKHGTISLIEEGTLVVALATYDPLYEKLMSNVVEVKSRGASVLALTTDRRKTETEKETGGCKRVDYVLSVPDTHEMLLPSLAVLPLQLFSYYVALLRGCDIDKPRNLAKSVTVE
ncbi:MAG: glutamine--fructose-6-phosphate transaminase (isomerizing) [Oscillospiraceae bacterium]|jgi:glucosamine--fructose-6-phosphate aminotransferase (isomerizing)